jgi:hypothetical protein
MDRAMRSKRVARSSRPSRASLERVRRASPFSFSAVSRNSVALRRISPSTISFSDYWDDGHRAKKVSGLYFCDSRAYP